MQVRRATAAALLAELEDATLTVELLPAPRPAYDGHCVRVATSVNPPWYRRLASLIPPRHRRASRCTSGIRRSHVLAALRRIAAGLDRGTAWEARLNPLLPEVWP